MDESFRKTLLTRSWRNIGAIGQANVKGLDTDVKSGIYFGRVVSIKNRKKFAFSVRPIQLTGKQKLK